MRAKDIPEFIFRGAVVSVDGREETVKEFSLQTPAINGQPVRGAQVLYMEFKSGLTMEYDVSRVREIPGKLPDFIREGAMLFVKDPPSKNPDENRFRTAGNGTWEITKFHFEKDGNIQRLRLLLKRPWVPGPGILSRHFNPRTMTPVDDTPDIPKAPPTPVYELHRDITVGKPITFRPKS